MINIFHIIYLLHLIFIHISSINGFHGVHKKIVQEGDLTIGVLLPVHEQPTYNSSKSPVSGDKRCGKIRDQYGIQRVEALLYLLDQINSQRDFLPGIKIGIDIRDDCWDTSIALKESIDFIRESINSTAESDSLENFIISNDKNNLSNVTVNECSGKLSSTKNYQNKIIAVIGPFASSDTINVQNLLQLFDIPQVGYSATSTDLSNKKMFRTFVRVVPNDSLQVETMLNILNKFNWTYIHAVYTEGSYGQAGMNLLRNGTRQNNICINETEKIQDGADEQEFERAIVKLNRTAKATVIVCFCYGETVRGLLRAINKFSLKGRFLILGSEDWGDRVDIIQEHYEEALGSFSIKAYSPKVEEFDSYFTQLNPDNNKRNIWFNEYWEDRFKCYIDPRNKDVYLEPCKRKCPYKFIEHENECWYVSTEEVISSYVQEECRQVHYKANPIKTTEIDKIIYLLNRLKFNYDRLHITYEKSIRNRYCNNDIFDLENSCLSAQVYGNFACANKIDCNIKLPFICKYTPQNDISYPDSLHNYQQDQRMSYLMNALLAIAHSLKDAYDQFQTQTDDVSEQMKQINGSVLLEYIRRVNFFSKISKKKISFDKNGDPPGKYDILNVQKNDTSLEKFMYKEVGSWENLKFDINDDDISFPNQNKVHFKSQCSESCGLRFIKQKINGEQECCSECIECPRNAYKKDDFNCAECGQGLGPNQNFSSCDKLPVSYLKTTEPLAILSLIVSIIGFILNTFILIIFTRYAATCIVKATTRELSFMILSATYLCHFIILLVLLKPSDLPCYLFRILPGLSLSIIYGAILTKTIRISRLLTRSKKRIFTMKLRFMSLKAQIVVTVLITLIECVVIGVTIFFERDSTVVSHKEIDNPVRFCHFGRYNIICSIVFNFILICFNTYFAFRARNLPENFNEAKFIGFSMYSTYIIWIPFFAVYFSDDYKTRIFSLCICTSISATVILLFLFIPKIYIILFEPERNQRSAFVTSKDLRMHFGSSPTIINSEVKNDSIHRSGVTKSSMKQRSISRVDTLKSTINLSSENSLQNQNRSCQTSRDLLVEIPQKDKNHTKATLKRSTSFTGYFHSLNNNDCYYKL